MMKNARISGFCLANYYYYYYIDDEECKNFRFLSGGRNGLLALTWTQVSVDLKDDVLCLCVCVWYILLGREK